MLLPLLSPLQDGTVTLRHRDSTRQQRLALATVLGADALAGEGGGAGADAVLRGFFDGD